MTATSKERIDLRMPAEPASVPALRRAAIAFATQHELSDPYAIGLAVSEAATNAVLHAYPEGQAGDVRVVACLEADRLVVVVRDWGPGPMQPRTDSPGMGLGLPTIATVADALQIEAADGTGTLLRMHFPRVAA